MTTPLFSVIIPVYNGMATLRRCLVAVQQSTFTDWELIVVDDGSTDGSGPLATELGAMLLHTAGQQGPAAARNLGAQAARGEYLFFTDADCEIHADTLAAAAQIFQQNPALDALFGSYDDQPGAPNMVAQYKNLFHHYVHQTSHERATTFWTGCGAIKRARFLALGGFDIERYARPSIEDIDLGYRLTLSGGQIQLAKHVQVKHLKAWTLPTLLKSDIFDRGIPWTQLLLRYRTFDQDLNLQTHNRLSVVAVWGMVLALGIGLLKPRFRLASGGLVVSLMGLLSWLNFDLYRFFYRQRGGWFTAQALLLHWLYYFYNAISFACGVLLSLKK